MKPSIPQIKRQMCDVGRRIWLKGFCAGNEGNHSVRIGPDLVLCTPTGVSKGFLKPADICLIDREGRERQANRAGRKRSSEALLHLAIYKARPDVAAVVHSHAPHATAFAVANIPLPEGIHPEAEIFLGRVPLTPYATPSTAALPASVVKVIRPETCAVLMGNHGAVTFSATLLDAYYKLEILEAYCRLLILSRQIGAPRRLTPRQRKELLKIKSLFAPAQSPGIPMPGSSSTGHV